MPSQPGENHLGIVSAWIKSLSKAPSLGNQMSHYNINIHIEWKK